MFFMQSNPLIDSQIFKLVIAPWIFYWDYFAHACRSSRQTRSVHIFLWFIWRHTVILKNILYLLITIIHFVVLLKYSNPVGPKQNRRIWYNQWRRNFVTIIYLLSLLTLCLARNVQTNRNRRHSCIPSETTGSSEITYFHIDVTLCT